MVFGQSGGGAKIATMMGMPAARGLFHRAATMSGQQVTASGPLHATARTRAFLGRLGIVEDDLSPLLATPAERLVEAGEARSEEHTSELQSLMRISYAVFCLK